MGANLLLTPAKAAAASANNVVATSALGAATSAAAVLMVTDRGGKLPGARLIVGCAAATSVLDRAGGLRAAAGLPWEVAGALPKTNLPLSRANTALAQNHDWWQPLSRRW